MRAGTCRPSVDSRKLLCNAGDYGETSAKTASIMEVEIQKLSLDSVSSTSPVLPARLLFLLLLHCCLSAAARHPLSHILHPSSNPPLRPLNSTPRPTHCVGVDSSLPPMVPGVVQRGSGPSTSSSTGENNLRLGSQPLPPPPHHRLPPPPTARRRKARARRL